LSAISGTVLKRIGESDPAFRKVKELNTSNLRYSKMSNSCENTENEGSKIYVDFYRPA